MSGCCSERGCTRKQPFLILHSRLTGRYYLATDYVEPKRSELPQVHHRHDITEQVEAILKQQREATT